MPAIFQLLASHPALDFINTLDNRFRPEGSMELMPTYAALLAFVDQTSLLDAQQISMLRKRAESRRTIEVLRDAHRLRETLATMFYAAADRRKPAVDSLKVLESFLLQAQQHRKLVWTRAGAAADATGQAVWEWGRAKIQPELPIWAITQSAADLLTSSAMNRVRICASQTCRWLFLDMSKNHSRRWCDMKLCGNRMKARRFQARRPQDASG